MKQFLVGTPGIISMSVMDSALDIFADIEVAAIRDKSLALTDYFMQRLANSDACADLVSLSPTAHVERGSQLSYSHPRAYAICQALIAMGVIADFRAPDILRLGFSPLYLSFSDLDRAVEALESVMRDKSYLDEQYQQRNAVT
jgi:kynureninase